MNNNKPYAVFIGKQEDINGKRHSLFNLIGGDNDGSTVSYKTLQAAKIPIVRTIIYRFIRKSFMTWQTIKTIQLD